MDQNSDSQKSHAMAPTHAGSSKRGASSDEQSSADERRESRFSKKSKPGSLQKTDQHTGAAAAAGISRNQINSESKMKQASSGLTADIAQANIHDESATSKDVASFDSILNVFKSDKLTEEQMKELAKANRTLGSHLSTATQFKMEENARAKIDREVIERVRAELREEVKTELKEEVKAELKAELREEVNTELEEEVKAELKAELREEVMAGIKEESEELQRVSEKFKKENPRSSAALPTLSSVPEVGKVVCAECDKRFETTRDLRTHLRRSSGRNACQDARELKEALQNLLLSTRRG